jgi:3-oxoacyl-[acyl-carrier protein] reductase
LKKVFITGSSSGIGFAAAKIFIQNGYNVFINGRNSEKLETARKELAAYGNVNSFLGDVSDYDTAEGIFEKIGDVDVLINNAGISYVGLFNLMNHTEWENIIKNNLYSTMNCSNIAVKKMILKHSGNIINISSIWGNAGASCEVAYSASKGAINAFTKALAKETAPSGIRVNAVACGVINTEMNSFLNDEEKTQLIDEIPASRFGEPKEIGEMLLFLASDKAAYLNGQIITVDGAML